MLNLNFMVFPTPNHHSSGDNPFVRWSRIVYVALAQGIPGGIGLGCRNRVLFQTNKECFLCWCMCKCFSSVDLDFLCYTQIWRRICLLIYSWGIWLGQVSWKFNGDTSELRDTEFWEMATFTFTSALKISTLELFRLVAIASGAKYSDYSWRHYLVEIQGAIVS